MPIDNHFSKSAFVTESKQEPALMNLAGALEAEIQAELHEVILSKIREIVGRLNAMGHRLEEYTPPTPGDISFRDEVEEDGTYTCLLRLGVDTIVSVGFKDVVAEHDET